MDKKTIHKLQDVRGLLYGSFEKELSISTEFPNFKESLFQYDFVVYRHTKGFYEFEKFELRLKDPDLEKRNKWNDGENSYLVAEYLLVRNLLTQRQAFREAYYLETNPDWFYLFKEDLKKRIRIGKELNENFIEKTKNRYERLKILDSKRITEIIEENDEKSRTERIIRELKK